MSRDGVPLFDELWDYNDPQGTATKMRALLPEAKSADDPSYLAQLLTQIARTHSLQREFDEAHRLLDRVEAMLSSDLVTARIRYLLERGRTFNSSNNKEQARALFAEAWEVASSEGLDFFAIDAAHMMGIAEASAESQLSWNLKALELAKNTNNQRAQQWAGSLYNNIGWTYHDMGDFEQALAQFEDAVRFHEKKPDRPIPIRIARWCVAKTLRALNRPQEALTMQQALLNEWEESGDEQDGYVFEELGECLLALGRQDEAQPYFASAHDLLSQDPWLVANEPKRLKRLEALGKGGT